MTILTSFNDLFKLQISACTYEEAEEDSTIRENVCASWRLGPTTMWNLGDLTLVARICFLILSLVALVFSCETWHTALRVPTLVATSVQLQSNNQPTWLEAQNYVIASNWVCPTWQLHLLQLGPRARTVLLAWRSKPAKGGISLHDLRA